MNGKFYILGQVEISRLLLSVTSVFCTFLGKVRSENYGLSQIFMKKHDYLSYLVFIDDKNTWKAKTNF